jgi:hypothetical protein
MIFHQESWSNRGRVMRLPGMEQVFAGMFRRLSAAVPEAIEFAPFSSGSLNDTGHGSQAPRPITEPTGITVADQKPPPPFGIKVFDLPERRRYDCLPGRDHSSEHAAIYRAIRDGDADGAALAATVHLDNTLEDYRREIKRRLFG